MIFIISLLTDSPEGGIDEANVEKALHFLTALYVDGVLLQQSEPFICDSPCSSFNGKEFVCLFIIC